MTMTDPIADMLTRIRNANVAMHDEVRMPSSKQKVALAEILQQEGYIAGLRRHRRHGSPGRVLTITMKYSPERVPHDLGPAPGVEARPAGLLQGRRVPRVLGGLGVAVLSTSQGLMTDREARASAAWAAKSSVTCGEGARCPASARHRSPSRAVSTSPSPAATSRSRARRAASRTLPGAITVRQDGDTLLVERPDDERENRALHGLTRSLVNNMVVGVTDGFRKELEIVGVGYRAEAQGPARSSWPSASATPCVVDAPDGITFEVPAPTRIVVRRHRQGSGRPGGRQHPRASASPSPTRARACATPASASCARPARPGSEQANERSASHDQSAAKRRPASAATAACARTSAARPSGRASPCSARTEHLCPGHRRRAPAARWPRRRRVEADVRSAGATGNIAAAKSVGKLVAERAKAAGVDQGRVRPRRLPLPRPGRGAADAAREAGLEF